MTLGEHIKIEIVNCYDAEAPEREYREYNYLAHVEVLGTRRDKYFVHLKDALDWAYCKALTLANMHEFGL